MYIEQAYKGFTERWRYFVGFLIVIVGWQFLGGIPLIAAMILKSDSINSISTDYGAMADTLGLNFFFLLVLLTFFAAMVSLWVAVKFIHRLSFKDFTTSRKRIDWKRITFSFVLWGVVSSALVFLDIYFSPENYEFSFEAGPFLVLLLISIIFIPIQTSFEEYFTRGYLMQSIGIASKNKWLPFVVSSSLFGLLHILNPEVDKLGYGILIYYIGTGFFLGILTLMDKGLELPLQCRQGFVCRIWYLCRNQLTPPGVPCPDKFWILRECIGRRKLFRTILLPQSLHSTKRGHTTVGGYSRAR